MDFIEDKINKISIIIPVYNEEKTIREIIKKVELVDLGYLQREIIIIDDGSTDQTAAILKSIPDSALIRKLCHDRNYGKGMAIQTGLKNISGEIIIIQDADLEYEPRDYHDLIQPILDKRADVVFGSRFMGDKPRHALFFGHCLANRMITFLSNIMTGLNLTDIETGYKVFKRAVADKIKLKEKHFGFEPEFTIKIARQKFKIYEVGISYYGRDYSEGKKIKFKDGLRTLWCILKYKFFD